MADPQQQARDIIQEHLQRGDGVGWFEPFYAAAHGNPAAIPWAASGPRRDLVQWARERHIAGNGQSALVVGCGLGDDAEFLAELGYRVTAFDISATAIDWCKERFPETAVDYRVADMFAPPAAWLGGFDLVVEDYIVQALPPEMRTAAVRAVAAFPAPGGLLLAIGRGIEDGAVRSGPPWPLTGEELALFSQAGLSAGSFHRGSDPAIAPQFRYRAEFRREARSE
ncbi:MAG: class I SAM-dependent methyltransferase [Caldilineaceae bacterium]